MVDDLCPRERIFVNTDDDNINGIEDKDDTSTEYKTWIDGNPQAAFDNDFAETWLLFDGPALDSSVLNGYSLRVNVGNNFSVWKSTQKDDFNGATAPFRSSVTWPLGDDYGGSIPIGGLPADSDNPVYIEGHNEATGFARWQLLKGGQVVASDRTRIRAEDIVWPTVQQTLEPTGWNFQHTNTGDGLELGDAWYINKALVDYINSPLLGPGQIETIHPDTTTGLGTISASKVGDLSESTESFVNGFTMEFDYSFERRGNVGWGYVPYFVAPTLKDKLSFVGNSGVKFGSTKPDGSAGQSEVVRCPNFLYQWL